VAPAHGNPQHIQINSDVSVHECAKKPIVEISKFSRLVFMRCEGLSLSRDHYGDEIIAFSASCAEMEQRHVCITFLDPTNPGSQPNNCSGE
jgi:hypothetical protein